MSTKLISIITVNFNQPEATVAFLESVIKNAGDENIEVILVDNGSEKFLQSEFEQAFPNLVYVKSERNLGFAGGNNLGIRKARGEYLFLINNDTEITPGVLGSLRHELDSKPDIGLVSPLILYHDNPRIIQYAGFTEMNYLTGRNQGIGYQELNEGQYDAVSTEVGFCHGAAMMCRSEDLHTVGLMEEQYFLYYEELDWCEKFKRAGKRIWFCGKGSIYHKESMSVGKESNIKTYFMTRNRMLFIRRNAGIGNLVIFAFYYTFIACSRQIVKYLLKGRFDLAGWTLRGLLWNLNHSTTSKKLGFKINNR